MLMQMRSITAFFEYYSAIHNDGSFNKPEQVESVLKISIKDDKVLTKFGSATNELQLIDKLGVAQFAAKGGVASMGHCTFGKFQTRKI